jgi:hypothetical protein
MLGFARVAANAAKNAIRNISAPTPLILVSSFVEFMGWARLKMWRDQMG